MMGNPYGVRVRVVFGCVVIFSVIISFWALYIFFGSLSWSTRIVYRSKVSLQSMYVCFRIRHLDSCWGKGVKILPVSSMEPARDRNGKPEVCGLERGRTWNG